MDGSHRGQRELIADPTGHSQGAGGSRGGAHITCVARYPLVTRRRGWADDPVVRPTALCCVRPPVPCTEPPPDAGMLCMVAGPEPGADGAIAQLAERRFCIPEVRGSTPLGSTHTGTTLLAREQGRFVLSGGAPAPTWSRTGQAWCGSPAKGFVHCLWRMGRKGSRRLS